MPGAICTQSVGIDRAAAGVNAGNLLSLQGGRQRKRGGPCLHWVGHGQYHARNGHAKGHGGHGL